MQKIKILLVNVLLLLLYTQMQAQPITFIVKDVNTGFAVADALVTATAPNGKTSMLPVAANGKALFSAGAGKYNFSIMAKGYHSLETFFVTGAETIEANINLDPVAITPADAGRQLQISKDQMVISGYIRDADENTPLAGAQVSAGAYTAVSDSKGFFSMELPAAAVTEYKTPSTITLRIVKAGYAAHTIAHLYAIPGVRQLKVTLSAANAPRLRQQAEETETRTHGLFDRTTADEQQRYANPPGSEQAQKSAAELAVLAATVPSSIRVGTSCSCTSCSVVQVMSLEAYTQTGLDDEWIASWGAASLQAGAVAYRTYGAWYVLHPVSGSYDIASTTCNQAWQNDVYTSSKNAAIATAGTVLIKSGAIFRSEYSAENNNAGCGNGYSGTGTTWPCISDARCAGRTFNGHGRGMCQWGSSFWASDKTYLWILNHYYNPGSVTVQLPVAPPATVMTFTVKDQSSGAVVASTTTTVTRPNGTTSTLTTNASGVLVFGADSGVYTFTFSKSGYNALSASFAGGGADDSIAADINLDAAGLVVAAPGVPATIRVATSCACTACTNPQLQVMSLEAYVQTGLDDEWISSWNAASLQAGAVAYRSRGAWYVQHPVAGNYDISAAACHQTWQNDRAVSVKNAAIATSGIVLVKNGAIVKADYAAENNNAGCGDGFSGNGSTWACISDARCAGRTNNGSGKGMCQWGSSFWGTDQTYTWILNHYYGPDSITIQLPAATIAAGNLTKTSDAKTVAAENLRLAPNPVTGSEVTVSYTLEGAAQPATISLGDYNGRIVRQQRVALQQGYNQLRVHTGKLKAGMYIVTIQLQTGKTESKKMMVAN